MEHELNNVRSENERLMSTDFSEVIIKSSLQGVLSKDVKYKHKVLFFFVEVIKTVTLSVFAVQSYRQGRMFFSGHDYEVKDISCKNATVPEVNFDSCEISSEADVNFVSYLVVLIGALYNAIIIGFSVVDSFIEHAVIVEYANESKLKNWTIHFSNYKFANSIIWIVSSSVIVIGYQDLSSILTITTVTASIMEMDTLILHKHHISVHSASNNILTLENKNAKRSEFKEYYFRCRVVVTLSCFIIPLTMVVLFSTVQIPFVIE